MNRILTGLTAGLAVATLSLGAHAVPFGGIEFPQGEISFADSVLSYDTAYSGGTEPTAPNFLDPNQALGAPDYNGSTGSVSLGSGGLIELLFTDNALTNSGDSSDDLHIFEIGPDVEDTFVAIRPTAATAALLGSGNDADGDGFFEIGKVFGATSSIDIDSIFSGYGAGTLLFDAVQLIDDPDEGATSGSTVGADIDAVGAIASAPPPPTVSVPEPGPLGLMALGLLLGGLMRWRKSR